MRNGLRLLVCAGAALAVAACATSPPPACPAGQQRLRTAQLFLRQNPGPDQVSEAAFRQFVDEELTPRFPDGLTVLDGGGQWSGPENKLIRESAKVVLIVLPERGSPDRRIDAVRTAYRERFHQDLMMRITAPACVTF
jgi:hypothetical protein